MQAHQANVCQSSGLKITVRNKAAPQEFFSANRLQNTLLAPRNGCTKLPHPKNHIEGAAENLQNTKSYPNLFISRHVGKATIY